MAFCWRGKGRMSTCADILPWPGPWPDRVRGLLLDHEAMAIEVAAAGAVAEAIQIGLECLFKIS